MECTLLKEGHGGLRRHGREHAVITNQGDSEVTGEAHANNADAVYTSGIAHLATQ
jgi:hypothetical protein